MTLLNAASCSRVVPFLPGKRMIRAEAELTAIYLSMAVCGRSVRVDSGGICRDETVRANGKKPIARSVAGARPGRAERYHPSA